MESQRELDSLNSLSIHPDKVLLNLIKAINLEDKLVFNNPKANKLFKELETTEMIPEVELDKPTPLISINQSQRTLKVPPSLSETYLTILPLNP